uniref:Uncharacterized protein n=1 Tax=Anguilla anguilla TaxID=7936 RepID=A0A0E9QN45_ANGAN
MSCQKCLYVFVHKRLFLYLPSGHLYHTGWFFF